MMQFIKHNMIPVGGSVIVLLAAFAYFTFFSNGTSEPLVATVQDGTSTVSKDLLISLSSLHVIRLDESIFQNPIFLSLSDFGVQIPPENIGRRNPFAPLGSK